MPSDLKTRLRDARRAKGWSQRELSERASMPQPHISRIENGAIDPKVSTLQDLARILDLELVLVPRTALAAVDALLREDAQDIARRRLREIVVGMWDAAANLQALAGGLNDRVAEAAEALSRLELSAVPPWIRMEILSAAGVVDEAMRGHSAQRLETAIASLNQVLTEAKTVTGADRPAYSLDED